MHLLIEEEILRKAEFKPYLWWAYVDDILFLWEHGEKKLKSFIDNINKMYRTIKFTADWSKASIVFLDVTVSITEGIIELNLRTVTNTFCRLSFLLQKGHTIQPGTKAWQNLFK